MARKNVPFSQHSQLREPSKTSAIQKKLGTLLKIHDTTDQRELQDEITNIL